MQRNSRRTLIVTALLLLSAGFVWQQQKRAAAPPAAGAGTTVAAAPAAAPASSPITAGGTTGTAGQGRSSAVGKGIPLAAPAVPVDSNGTFSAAPRPDSAEAALPKSNNAMPLEPLISQTGKQSLIARDGTPLRLELSPGVAASAVELQAWTDDQARNAAGRYDWRFKITVPAGGLVERPDPTVFTAPEGGYSADFDYAMDQDLPGSQWSNSLGKSFFIHFNNDTYGLLNVQMVAGGAHFVTVKAWLNPAAGSRNLQPPPPPPVKQR